MGAPEWPTAAVPEAGGDELTPRRVDVTDVAAPFPEVFQARRRAYELDHFTVPSHPATFDLLSPVRRPRWRPLSLVKQLQS